MSKRVTGAIFCSIAAFLFAIRYVVAALLQVARFSNQNIWGGGNALGVFFSAYEDTVKETGALLICSIIALVIGVVYLVWGECAEWIHHRREFSEDTKSTKSN
jgi:hypothetical protein